LAVLIATDGRIGQISSPHQLRESLTQAARDDNADPPALINKLRVCELEQKIAQFIFESTFRFTLKHPKTLPDTPW